MEVTPRALERPLKILQALERFFATKQKLSEIKIKSFEIFGFLNPNDSRDGLCSLNLKWFQQNF